MSITPSNEQWAAIKQIVKWYGDGNQFFYLAGFAGVGKSTICSIAIEEIKKQYKIKTVNTATYTGKAASILRKKGIDASTIHSMIYIADVDDNGVLHGFDLDRCGSASKTDLIVLDECSMIADEMAEDLLSFGKKILVMGDPGQLPPVNGMGYFTRNTPDVFLKEIYRQCADSPIIKLATMARKGEKITPGLYNDANILSVMLNNETQSHIFNPETQVICGLNRVRHTVTQKIRNRFGFNGEFPLDGERIICCKNDKYEKLFNGQMGIMKRDANKLSKTEYDEEYLANFKILMDDEKYEHILNVDPHLFKSHFLSNGKAEKIPYIKGREIKSFNEFDWAYAITCHKAQGSQWNHVTIVDDSSAFREDRNRWLYTAITRAETGLSLLMR